MEIRIGIVNAPRELSFESHQTVDEIADQAQASLTSGTGFLRLTDDKGKVYLVPVAGIAYIEIGSDESRRIGFVGWVTAVELLFVALGGAILGLGARYFLPRRHTHGSVLVPAIGVMSASVLWVALTWAGLKWNGGWIWWVTFVGTAVVVTVADLLIGRIRATQDDRLFATLSKGAVAR